MIAWLIDGMARPIDLFKIHTLHFSGIRHSGYDTDVNTLEGKCIALAAEPGDNFYRKSGVPLNKCGAIMVAWTKEQVVLNLILQQCPALA